MQLITIGIMIYASKSYDSQDINDTYEKNKNHVILINCLKYEIECLLATSFILSLINLIFGCK